MSTSVVISDFNQNKKIFLVFSEVDYDNVESAWTDPERFFTEVKNKTGYTQYHKWSELSLHQWQYLLIHKLDESLKLSDAVQQDETHPIISSLHFFLVGYCHKYQIETGSLIEMLKIQKVNEIDYNIMAYSTNVMSVENNPPRKPQLKVLHN